MMRYLLSLIFLFSFFLSKSQEQLTNIQNREIDQGSLSSNENSFKIVEINNNLLFYAFDDKLGGNLMVSNGEPDNAKVLSSRYRIKPNGFRSLFNSSEKLRNELFFYSERDFYKTDGTDLGTEKLDLFSSNTFRILNILKLNENQLLVFLSTFDENTSHFTEEIWVTDGTVLGTSKLKELPGEFIGTGFSKGDGRTTKHNGKIYFPLSTSNSRGTDVWVSDGTTLGTTKTNILDNYSGNFSGDALVSMKEANGKLYALVVNQRESSDFFRILDLITIKIEGNQVTEIFKIEDVNNDRNVTNQNLLEFNNNLYFSSVKREEINGNIQYNFSVTELNGVTEVANTIFIKNNIPTGDYLTDIIKGNNKLFFISYDDTNNVSLFSKEGNEVVEEEIDIINTTNLNLSGGFSDEFTNINLEIFGNDRVFISDFTGNSGSGDSEVFLTNELGGIVNIPNMKGTFRITEFNNKLYFGKFLDEGFGQEPWFSDGTNEGTQILDNISKLRFGVNLQLRPITEINGNILYEEEFINNIKKIYSFNTRTNTLDTIIDSGEALLRSGIGDRQFEFNSTYGYPTINNEKYFLINSSFSWFNNEIKLFKTDGTPTGTIEEEIPFTNENRYVAHILHFGNDFYFVEYRRNNDFDSQLQNKIVLTKYDGNTYTEVKDLGGVDSFRNEAPIRSYQTDSGFYILLSYPEFREVRDAEELNNLALIMSDGTNANTKSFKVDAGEAGIFNNDLYFSNAILDFTGGGFGDKSYRLSKVDFQTGELSDVKDAANNKIEGLISNFQVFNERLFFLREESRDFGRKLWYIDNLKSNAGKSNLISFVGSIDDRENSFFEYNGNLFFNSFSEGSFFTSILDRAFNVTNLSFDIFNPLVSSENELFFSSSIENGELGILKSDGTEQNTYFVGTTISEGPQFWRVNKTDLMLSTEDLEFLKNNEISIFPNPAFEKINFAENSKIQNISITNLLGQEVLKLKEQKNNTSIDVSGLSSGIYIINFLSKNGTQKSLKFLKK